MAKKEQEKKRRGKEDQAFDTLMEELAREYQGTELLDDCMEGEVERIASIPLRYRLIALGFLQGISLEQLNKKLMEKNCLPLYSRNYWEATLIFAFLHGLSYKEWRKLQQECRRIEEERSFDGKYFQEKKISYRELENYVRENSNQKEQELYTRHITAAMVSQLEKMDTDQQALKAFLQTNLEVFASVREKARYYFCKYLYFYLQDKIEGYLSACKASGFGQREAFIELRVLSPFQDVEKKKMTPEEKRRYLEGASISCKNIFDAFNKYYFHYVTEDWMDILFSLYPDVDSIPGEEQVQIAENMRKYMTQVQKRKLRTIWEQMFHEPKKKFSDYELLQAKYMELQQREEEEDEAYSLENEKRGYQKNRAGEHAVRNFIRGNLDMGRTTWICFLLFFGMNASLEEKYRITQERLNEMLEECGFSKLREEDDFDYFVMDYLQTEQKEEYLMEEMDYYAEKGENSFLYRIYGNAADYDAELREVMDIEE